MGKSSSPSIPRPPNISKSYGKGVDVYLKYLPQLLGAEQDARLKYDPLRVQQQQQLQDQYGAHQYDQQLAALNQLDPNFMKVRDQLGQQIQGDLSAGYGMTPDQQRSVEQAVRSSQAARGNINGGAAATAEAYAVGDRGLQLHQQRLSNAGSYLQTPSAVQEARMIAPVSPDRSSAYVDPNAGWQGVQASQQLYANQVGAAAAGSSGGSSWGGAASGIGSIIGAVLPLLFASDKRVKKDINKVGTGPSGVGIYEFAYKGKRQAPRFRGVMAQDVEKKIPGAVVTDPVTGIKKVDYSKVGIPMQRVS